MSEVKGGGKAIASYVEGGPETVWGEKKKGKVEAFLYVFFPVVALFSIANFSSGFFVMGGLEAGMAFTGLLLILFKKRMSVSLLSHMSVAQLTLLIYVLLFFPAVSHSAYMWVVALPFFTSYLVGSKATIRWSILFVVAAVFTGVFLFQQGYDIYWGWDKAFFIGLVYFVMTIFSILFVRHVERYINELRVAEKHSKEDKKALEESEARYRTLLHSSMNAVGVHRGGKWVYANPACLQLLGAKSFADIVNLPVIDFVHPEYRAMVIERVAEMSKTKKPVSAVEEKFLRLDGKDFPAEVSATPIIFDGEESFMITIKDVAERKEYEAVQKSLRQQLEHSQRLESLGVLAGGIAHDFNNFLAAIAGNAELLRLEVASSAQAKAYMDHIDDSCSHAAGLCKQLLAYAGKGKYVIETIDINDLVKSMSKLIRASVSSNIGLKVKLDSKLPMIEGDIAQIQQIILNFIINSADAIGDHDGEIKISTFTTRVDKSMVSSLYNGEHLSQGKHVVLEVKDNGSGMSKALQEKVFDPFFTTKELGSGLGLSAVLGIIRAHNGAVHLYSEEGRGTVFRIFMPISGEEPSSQVIVETGEVQVWEAKGLVLIVDDDVSVRDVARSFVEKIGFEVITADDGREGVDVYHQYHKRLSAVLLDMTMPRLGGVDAMREMRVINDDIPIVMVSGYSETETGGSDGSLTPDAFVQKPFRFKDVKKVLYKVLEI